MWFGRPRQLDAAVGHRELDRDVPLPQAVDVVLLVEGDTKVPGRAFEPGVGAHRSGKVDGRERESSTTLGQDGSNLRASSERDRLADKECSGSSLRAASATGCSGGTLGLDPRGCGRTELPHLEVPTIGRFGSGASGGR